MAKMFYTLDEAAERLGVTPSSVRDLVTQGRLQEFRDRDKLMFKVEQVELVAGEGEGHGGGMGEIPLASDQSGTGIPILADDPGASGLQGASGSGIPLEPETSLEGAKERSGISIFDADETEQADPSAVTQITTTTTSTELTMESVGSGSGLLDLTRESDDTSLGADLLQDVYGGEGSRAGGAAETGGTSGLFETTGAASDVSGGLAPAGAVVMVAAEPFDGAGSGFAGRVALAALLVAALATAIVVFGITSGNATAITNQITKLPSYPWSFIGAGALAVIVFALIGWLLGKRS